MVDFAEGRKPENPEKNPRSTGETNYNNSTHVSSKFFWESVRGYTQVVTHPAIIPPDQGHPDITPPTPPSSYNPTRSSLSYLKEQIKWQSKLTFSFWFPCFVFEIFQFLWYAFHIWRSIQAMTYRRMLYIFVIIKRNHFEVFMCMCFSHDTKHVHFEVISFYNSKDI